jgi:hypothetical protein
MAAIQALAALTACCADASDLSTATASRASMLVHTAATSAAHQISSSASLIDSHLCHNIKKARSCSTPANQLMCTAAVSAAAATASIRPVERAGAVGTQTPATLQVPDAQCVQGIRTTQAHLWLRRPRLHLGPGAGAAASRLPCSQRMRRRELSPACLCVSCSDCWVGHAVLQRCAMRWLLHRTGVASAPVSSFPSRCSGTRTMSLAAKHSAARPHHVPV